MVDEHVLYRRDRPHAPVVHVLENVIHPVADIAQVRPLQRGNDARRVGMTAQADLVELAEQLRRGYRKLRLADDEHAVRQRRQRGEQFAAPARKHRAAADAERNIRPDLRAELFKPFDAEPVPERAVQPAQHCGGIR